MSEAKPPILKAADIASRSHEAFSHPWNPKSEIRGVQLAREAGLKRAGVSFARVAPGKESFAYHVHYREEEWIYILSGRAMVEIDGREHEVGPGDFIAFPTSVAHHLRNPFDAEVTYLMGGEHHDFEVADFPGLGKRMMRRGSQVEVFDLASAKPFGPLEE